MTTGQTQTKSTTIGRPVHFEFNSPRPDDTQRFFERVFGWKTMKWEGPMDYRLFTTGDNPRGIDGGLIKSRDGRPATVNTIGVASLDDTIREIKGGGGAVAVEKMPIQGIGWLAYCTDPAGILFGVLEPDETAG